METMAFEEALGRLKAFEECSRRHAQVGGERSDGQLLLTEQEWRARDRNSTGNSGKKKNTFDIRKVRCYNCQDYGISHGIAPSQGRSGRILPSRT